MIFRPPESSLEKTKCYDKKNSEEINYNTRLAVAEQRSLDWKQSYIVWKETENILLLAKWNSDLSFAFSPTFS